MNGDLDSLTASLHEVMERSDQNDHNRVLEIVVTLKARYPTLSSIRLLLDSALYFESIGNTIKAHEIAEFALNEAIALKDRNLERQAHSIVGVVSSRRCDFQNSLMHLEIALKIAQEMREDFCEFAVLGNIVATLPLMGLLREAKALALKNTLYPTSTQNLNILHLQNSISGLQLSQSTSDKESLQIFKRVADRSIGEVPSVSVLTQAYYDAHHAYFLLSRDCATEAYEYIQSRTEDRSGVNVRANATLVVARAACAIALKSSGAIKESEESLLSIMPLLSQTPFHYEDVLRALQNLYRVDLRKASQKKGVWVVRTLKQHLINVKHRQFFERVNLQSGDGLGSVSLEAPHYDVSGRFLRNSNVSNHKIEVSKEDFTQDHSPVNSSAKRRAIEKAFRSNEFEIAEEWAISADFFAHRGGQHCFEVGALAGLLARRIGWSESDSVLMEMACRLHDIGKVLVDSSLQRGVSAGTIDSYVVLREHTLMGGRLLSASSDAVLRFAVNIAHSHHEWWNGCGYPDALAGFNIPIEARICSVADAYLVHLYPGEDRIPWRKDEVIRQVRSMAGVQLDPDIVGALQLLVEESSSFFEDIQVDVPLGKFNDRTRSLISTIV